jgi:hypothetical protein
LGSSNCHQRRRWRNNRAENSHQPTRRRERKMQRFKSAGFRPEIPVNARRRLQHLQLPTSYHFSPNAPRASRCGDGHMADRRRSSLKIPAADASRSPPWQCDNPASRHDTAVRCSPPGNLAWKAGGPPQPYPHAAFGLGFRPRTMATRMTLRTRRLEFS